MQVSGFNPVRLEFEDLIYQAVNASCQLQLGSIFSAMRVALIGNLHTWSLAIDSFSQAGTRPFPPRPHPSSLNLRALQSMSTSYPRRRQPVPLADVVADSSLSSYPS